MKNYLYVSIIKSFLKTYALIGSNKIIIKHRKLSLNPSKLSEALKDGLVNIMYLSEFNTPYRARYYNQTHQMFLQNKNTNVGISMTSAKKVYITNNEVLKTELLYNNPIFDYNKQVYFYQKFICSQYGTSADNLQPGVINTFLKIIIYTTRTPTRGLI